MYNNIMISFSIMQLEGEKDKVEKELKAYKEKVS